jgi:hypothetical protein
MHDLKQRLEALSEEGAPRGAAEVMQAARRSLDDVPSLGSALVRQKTSRRHVVVAFAVVLVVALVVSAALVLRDSDRNTNLVPVVPAPNDLRDLFTTSPATPSPEERLFLVPGFVPNGMTPLRVMGSREPRRSASGGGSTEIDRAQLWVKLDPAGTRPIDHFSVQWGPGAVANEELHPTPEPAPHTDDPLAGYRRDSVPVAVRDHDGLYSKRVGTLVWEEPKGHMVAITGESLALGDMVDMAEALEPRPDGGFALTQAPPEFVQVSEVKGFAWDGVNERELIYQDAAHHAFQVRIVDASDVPPGQSLSAIDPGLGADPRIVDVRGHHAVLTNFRLSGGGTFDSQTMFLQSADKHLQWLERDNVMVTVSTVGLSEEQVLAIADGLQEVDDRGWDQLLVQAPGRSGAPTPKPSADPPSFTGEEGAIAAAYQAWLSSTTDADATAATIEGGEQLRDTLVALGSNRSLPPSISGRVVDVRLVGADHALVTFSILSDGAPLLDNQQGAALRVNGEWLVSRATFCSVISIIGTQCPAR